MLKIEQCRKLNISSLDTNDGCSHIAEAECDGQKFPVAYAFDLNDDSRVVNISFQSNNKIQKQTIAIEMVELPLGDKAYFGCDCGKRCSILYQKPDGGVFACREWFDLGRTVPSVLAQ